MHKDIQIYANHNIIVQVQSTKHIILYYVVLRWCLNLSYTAPCLLNSLLLAEK